MKTPRKPSAFAFYVKENYSSVKKSGVTHAQVMKELSANYSTAKKNKPAISQAEVMKELGAQFAATNLD